MPEPRRRRRAVLLALLAAVLAGALPFVAGVDLAHTVAFALGAAAITLVVQSMPPVPRLGWPLEPDHDEGTGWHQVRLLSQALEQLDSDPDRVGAVLLPRLRALATSHLRAAGVEPTSPRARELLGADLYDALGGTGTGTGTGSGTGSGTARRGRGGATDLTRRLLDRLDELDQHDRLDQHDATTTDGAPR